MGSQDHKEDREMQDREEKEEEEREKEGYILPHKVHTQGTKKKNLNNVFQKVDQNPESILNKSVLINNMLRSIQNQILVEASEVKDKAVPVAVKDKLVGCVVT